MPGHKRTGKDLGAKNAGRSYQRLGPPAWQSKLMAIAGQRIGFILPDDAREKLGPRLRRSHAGSRR
jgi:hypothetical protein